MKYLLITLFTLSFFICPYSYANDEPPTPNWIEYTDRKIEDWSIDKSIVEANDDILKRKIKIYYSGTIAAYPPGVNENDMYLIKDLPIANAGIGCIILDSKLRKTQLIYAEKYNEIIIEYLKKSNI